MLSARVTLSGRSAIAEGVQRGRCRGQFDFFSGAVTVSGTSLAMLGLRVEYGLSRRSLLSFGRESEEGDELPDVGETLQVLDHVAHPVDVLWR